MTNQNGNNRGLEPLYFTAHGLSFFHAGSMMTQDCLPHAPDSEHGKLAPCMERVLKLTRVLPACFQVNQVKTSFPVSKKTYVNN